MVSEPFRFRLHPRRKAFAGPDLARTLHEA